MKIKAIAYSIIIGLLAISCVSAKKHKELETNYNSLTVENYDLKNSLRDAQDNIQGLEANVTSLSREVTMLKIDTARIGNQIRKLTNEVETANQLLANRDAETRQILARLQAREEDIADKEENLRNLMLEFDDKEARLRELEFIMSQQEAAVNQLRQAVSSALLGFENNGLTIEIRNGKVYVSLEESLLFASGSTTVDRRGETALKELAKVLEANPDINIMIEGHTDDVPLRSGSAIRDNWDLSVLRATAIVRILKSSGEIDPKRFTVAGRGEHLPVDPEKTPEARRKNRRTEIILTPKLDTLFQILDMN
jgi:chemotaxis protein MotB